MGAMLDRIVAGAVSSVRNAGDLRLDATASRRSCKVLAQA